MSKSENRKMLSTRISEELIDELTYYRKVNLTGELSQVDYITKAIEEKNERVRHLRDGGRYIKYYRIPIENRNVDIKKVQQARDILFESAKEMLLLGEFDVSQRVIELIRLIEEDMKMSNLEIRKISDRNSKDINFEEKNYYKYNSDESEEEI
jgi:hypothetical protein